MSLLQPDAHAANVAHYIEGAHHARTDGERVSRALLAHTEAMLAVASALQQIAEAIGSRPRS